MAESSRLEGTWHIYNMELWDEDYFNMEVQAYIDVDKNGNGNFQFGLVSGSLYGQRLGDKKAERLEFTWEGNDECDEASGSGWIELKDKDILKGHINLHGGDHSQFSAKRA
ncbi:MAG: hypothetical protein AAFN40_15920 [Cyanobacteria bacterium J06560_6]